ncbi:4Fe-4S binding protein [Petroclostridium sp. X23]|uniref:ATP-binding protein n=1 Tax=Petroclostridium sp. X23 TaxID=3045146 RepID=UPI0024AE6D8D|nr:4Fe-4S binding protein [Petroclostridium sp. X23]WHH58085.1 4Fe-4S binding protein [Petroclostridium sp. X23]
MKRRIIHIDEEKCNGCGLCVTACHEGAIEMVNGKAKLLSDEYCDGLGDCLPECPTGAITMIEREAVAYDQEAVDKKMAEKKAEKVKKPVHSGCPGMAARMMNRTPVNNEPSVPQSDETSASAPVSELRQWPVQLNLVNPNAQYFKGVNLLIAADCVAYAHANFHKDFIKGHTTVIGCPKLDDNEHYKEKLTEILKNNDIASITVVRMEVPCCGGIVQSVRTAMLQSETIVPYREVVIGVEGNIVKG